MGHDLWDERHLEEFLISVLPTSYLPNRIRPPGAGCGLSVEVILITKAQLIIWSTATLFALVAVVARVFLFFFDKFVIFLVVANLRYLRGTKTYIICIKHIIGDVSRCYLKRLGHCVFSQVGILASMSSRVLFPIWSLLISPTYLSTLARLMAPRPLLSGVLLRRGA